MAYSSTTASGVAASSGNVTIFSSVSAGFYVYGFSLTYAPGLSSASLGGSVPILVTFTNGAGGTELWRCPIWPSTIGTSPPFEAITPPGYLFRTDTGVALVMNTQSSGMHYSVAAYKADIAQ